MKKIVIPIDGVDLEAMRAKIDATILCPSCKHIWHSPFPKTRKLCPECFKRLTGYDYTL